jgi:hypothetical protein
MVVVVGVEFPGGSTIVELGPNESCVFARELIRTAKRAGLGDDATYAEVACIEPAQMHSVDALRAGFDSMKEALGRIRMIAHDYRLYDIEAVAAAALAKAAS